jgi:hypothetical protein
MRPSLPLILSVIPLAACASEVGDGAGDGLGRTGGGGGALALVSSTGEVGVLRRGETLNLRADAIGELSSDTIYRAEVRNGETVLAATDVLTDRLGKVLLAALLHDVGENDDADPGDTLQIRMMNDAGEIEVSTDIVVEAPPALQVPGWNVTEIQPPHVYATDAAGAPQNAFAVPSAAAGEVGGAVHLAGEGFPDSVAGRDVDVYVVRDHDEWRERAIPTAGDADHVAGPIAAHVDEEGHLAPVAVFTPDLDDVGIYDTLVDVDRDGRFEWRFDGKDGADGLAKVGFTIQYSRAWLETRTSSHLLVNIAYDSHGRDDGTWRNEYAMGEPVFLYLNPPVMQQYHYEVTKWIVRHQDFDAFWNDPAMADADGAVPFQMHESRSMSIVTERGCTNSSPTCFGVLEPGGDEDGDGRESYDVVFDRDGDGRYMPGTDLLDILSTDSDGDVVSVEEFRRLPAAGRVGFSVLTR